jgi:hypothetical protein
MSGFDLLLEGLGEFAALLPGKAGWIATGIFVAVCGIILVAILLIF